jgi:hypothetical protein
MRGKITRCRKLILITGDRNQWLFVIYVISMEKGVSYFYDDITNFFFNIVVKNKPVVTMELGVCRWKWSQIRNVCTT